MSYDVAISYRRPELAKYIVSMRPTRGAWPDQDRRAIMAARKAYNAGTIELCQGRELGDRFALYAIPRKRPTRARRNVFGETRYYDNHPHHYLRPMQKGLIWPAKT